MDAQDRPSKRKAKLPSDSIVFPVCPYCRATLIDVKRYKGITKRANLDLQERNFFLSTRKNLAKVVQAFASLAAPDQGQAKLWKLPLNINTVAINKAQKTALRKLLQLGERSIDMTKIRKASEAFGKTWPKDVINAWTAKTDSLHLLDQQLQKLVRERPPHKAAYDAAYTIAFRQKKAELHLSGSTTLNHEAQCRQAAEEAVGMPPPRADDRLSIEATWLALEIVGTGPIPLS